MSVTDVPDRLPECVNSFAVTTPSDGIDTPTRTGGPITVDLNRICRLIWILDRRNNASRRQEQNHDDQNRNDSPRSSSCVLQKLSRLLPMDRTFLSELHAA